MQFPPMSRKSQDHLHRLIRSMSSAERRYFKLFIGRHAPEGGTSQQLLFDAIAGMDHYDEAAIRTRFKHEAFIKHLAIAKRRLYETILRCLDVFHAESSVDARLNRTLHQVEILYHRALYTDAEKMLHSVRRLAETHDRTPALLAVAEWQRRLIECHNYAQVSEGDLDQLAADATSIMEEQLRIAGLWDLKSRLLLILYREGQVRDEGTRSRVRAFLQHPLLRKEPLEGSSAKARFYFHHIHSAAAFAVSDMGSCQQHLIANLSLLNANKEQFSEEPNLVLGVMSNLIYTYTRLGRSAEAFDLLKHFRTAPSQWNMPESDDLDLKLFSTTTSLELSIHSRLGAFDKAVELVPVVERGLAQHGERLGPVRRSAFRYQVAYAYFGAGNYDKTTQWLNDLLNNVGTGDSSDTVCFGRMLQLITLLDSDKTDQLSYTLRNTERFLRTRERQYRFEPLLLTFIRNLSKARTEEARRSLMVMFRDELGTILRDPLEQAVLDHFDPIAWIESALTGKGYAALVQGRALDLKDAA
ncbi:MAG: hypothetical protein IT226_15125 [Flavobacteriales bacterium]|nr:hypothetical protein [Flavobacteriales bacterium]